MLTSADAFIGKSFKYLSIFDKSLRKYIVDLRPDDGVLTVEYLIDILTPGTVEDIPSNIIQPRLNENSTLEILNNAKDRLVKLINTLQANYWEDLTEVIFSRKKWDAISLLAAFLLSNTRRSIVIYNALIELYVQLTVLRTVEDQTDMSIQYEESGSW